MVLGAGESVRRFTLVVSQFEKTGTINFSVRAYSTLPFSMEKIKNPWRHKEEVSEVEQKYLTNLTNYYLQFTFRSLVNGKVP